MNAKLNLRLRVMIIGFATGAGGAALCLTMTFWMGINGGAVGIVIAAFLGLTATLASIFTFEQLVREHLVATDDDSILSSNPPESTGDDDLNEMLATVRQSLRRARQASANAEDVDRMARTLWNALNSKSGTNGPPADTRQCISGLFEMFRQTADSLVRIPRSWKRPTSGCQRVRATNRKRCHEPRPLSKYFRTRSIGSHRTPKTRRKLASVLARKRSAEWSKFSA